MTQTISQAISPGLEYLIEKIDKMFGIGLLFFNILNKYLNQAEKN